jgi:hypothetical protein
MLVLPVNEKPFLIGYTHHAYPLSITSINDNYLPWFYSNFIQLKCFKKFPDDDYFIDFDFYHHFYNNYPWLKTEKLEETISINNSSSIIEYIINCLQDKTYICIFLNEFYIPHSFFYKKKDFTHETLVFGYEYEEQCFHTLGFDKIGQFKINKIKSSDFQLAYLNRESGRYQQRPLPIYKYQYNNHFSYKFNMENVYNLIDDYINCKNTSEKRNLPDRLSHKEHVYGVEVYDKLKLFYKDKSKNTDIRPIHLFFEHKKCMVNRIKFIEDNHYINQDYSFYQDFREIVKTTSDMRNILMKYRFNNDGKILEKFQNNVDRMAEKEVQILKNLLKAF